MSRPAKGLLVMLLVLPWAALVAGFGAEGYVRWKDRQAGRDASFFLPPPDPNLVMIETHPFIGYVYRPGISQRDPEKQYRYSINSLGMRGPELAAEKPPGVYRIFCLGGSTTYGTGATDDDRTYPARLEHYLNETAPAGVRYEVGNWGVTGYTTVENLINLELRLVELDPDAILVYAAANDARMIQARGFRPDYAHYRRSWVETELTPLDLWLLEHVRLYAWATRGLDPEKQLRSLGHPTFVPDFRELHVPSSQGVPEEGLEVFFRNLDHIALIAREHGIQTVLSTFATCPQRLREGEEDFLGTVAAINTRLPDFAAARELPVLDIAGALDGRCELFDDWMHLNDAGSDLHGKTAAEEARRLGLFGL